MVSCWTRLLSFLRSEPLSANLVLLSSTRLGTYSDTNAFLILRTGGIVIFNPEEKVRTRVGSTLGLGCG